MKQVVPVKGTPLCRETRTVIEYKLLEKTSEALVVEYASECLDSPACDTFLVREASLVFGIKSIPDQCIFLRLMLVDFRAFTFFKAIIKSKSAEGIAEHAGLWYKAMAKQGLFKARPTAPPAPAVEAAAPKDQGEAEATPGRGGAPGSWPRLSRKDGKTPASKK